LGRTRSSTSTLEKLNKGYMIQQFSPIRTGSTLVWNFLRQTYSDEVLKEHRLYPNLGSWIVTTIRHPYNAIISAILRLERPIDEESLTYCTNEFLVNGGLDILRLNLESPRVIVLKYEEFVDDYSYIVKKLNEKMGEGWSSKPLDKVLEELSVDNMLKIQNQHENFYTWDSQTQIHGNHISKYRGKTNWEEILTEEQVQFLQEQDELNQIIEKFY
jgi:hypothetical protein